MNAERIAQVKLEVEQGLVAELRTALREQKRASRKMLVSCREEVDSARKLVELATGKSFHAVIAEHAAELEGEAV